MTSKQVIFFLIIFFLIAIIPFIQLTIKPFKLVGLEGAFTTQEKPVFSFESILNNTYQNKAEAYLKDNAAFRGDLVRLRNQVNYSFLGDINTILTLGKENYLFDPNYIYAREGQDLLTDSAFKAHNVLIFSGCKKLKKRKIPLIFCIAPNKANYYHEFIPNISEQGLRTNQSVFDSLLKANKITVLNFDKLLIELKFKTLYPLIPKYGAHWSIYGAQIAADSFFKALSKENNTQYSKFNVSKIELDKKARFTDDDFLSSLNLIWKWKSPQMAYPILNFEQHKKPNLLIISDSYFWSFYDLGIVKNTFSTKSEMWYYNKSIYDINRNKIGERNNSVTEKDLNERDAIVIMATAPSLKDFAYGFFNQLEEIK